MVKVLQSRRSGCQNWGTLSKPHSHKSLSAYIALQLVPFWLPLLVAPSGGRLEIAPLPHYNPLALMNLTKAFTERTQDHGMSAI
jgi:hypothetical protein